LLKIKKSATVVTPEILGVKNQPLWPIFLKKKCFHQGGAGAQIFVVHSALASAVDLNLVHS
jgi:hypothetical protein